MSFSISYNFVSIDKFSRTAKRVKKSVDGVKNSVKKMNKTFGGGARAAGGFVKKLGSLRNLIFAGGLLLGLRKIVTEGTRFQDSMADLQAITGAVAEDLDALSASARKNSVRFAQSSSKIADAFTLVASKKPELLKNTVALADMTEKVLLLQAASGIDLSDAAIITAESLNIFGKSASDAGKFVDILAAGAKFGSSLIGQTGRAAVLAAPQFNKLGLSFLDLNAAIQTVARGGFTAERAGTALNAIFQKLSIAGIDFQKTGLVGGLQIVKRVLDGVTDNTKRAALEAKLFGEEHGKVAIPLLNNIRLIKQFQRELKTTGIAQEQANIRLATFSKRLKRVGIRIQNKLIDTFDRLEPQLISLTKSFTAWLDTIGPKQIESVVVGFRALFTILKSILFVARAISAIGGVVGAAAFKIFNPEAQESVGKPAVRPFTENATSTINVNLNAPEGVIKSVTSKSVGKTNFNLGQNGRSGPSPVFVGG